MGKPLLVLLSLVGLVGVLHAEPAHVVVVGALKKGNLAAAAAALTDESATKLARAGEFSTREVFAAADAAIRRHGRAKADAARTLCGRLRAVGDAWAKNGGGAPEVWRTRAELLHAFVDNDPARADAAAAALLAEYDGQVARRRALEEAMAVYADTFQWAENGSASLAKASEAAMKNKLSGLAFATANLVAGYHHGGAKAANLALEALRPMASYVDETEEGLARGAVYNRAASFVAAQKNLRGPLEHLTTTRSYAGLAIDVPLSDGWRLRERGLIRFYDNGLLVCEIQLWVDQKKDVPKPQARVKRWNKWALRDLTTKKKPRTKSARLSDRFKGAAVTVEGTDHHGRPERRTAYEASSKGTNVTALVREFGPRHPQVALVLRSLRQP